MSVEFLERALDVIERHERDVLPPLFHVYATPWGRDPVPGDVALCGWVKREPHEDFTAEASTCVVCESMCGGVAR